MRQLFRAGIGVMVVCAWAGCSDAPTAEAPAVEAVTDEETASPVAAANTTARRSRRRLARPPSRNSPPVSTKRPAVVAIDGVSLRNIHPPKPISRGAVPRAIG